MESGQFSAAIAAIREMGVLSGQRIERKEVESQRGNRKARAGSIPRPEGHPQGRPRGRGRPTQLEASGNGSIGSSLKSVFPLGEDVAKKLALIQLYKSQFLIMPPSIEQYVVAPGRGGT
jgi:hypothetical protein